MSLLYFNFFFFFKYETIETYAPAFLSHNNSSVARVKMEAVMLTMGAAENRQEFKLGKTTITWRCTVGDMVIYSDFAKFCPYHGVLYIL